LRSSTSCFLRPRWRNAWVEFVFAALARLERAKGWPTISNVLMAAGISPDRLSAGFQAAGLGRFPRRPASSLSGGERVKALLCGAFLSGADYLLLDEPTNHLDRQGRGVALSPAWQWRAGR
jgi:ATPase subunit of ABC transporter with duplicated ATPase domains